MSESYFLGIDAGGTKTKAIITNHANQVISRAQAPGGNIHNLGIKAAFENITKAVDQAKQSAQPPINNFHTACVGIAGLDTPEDGQQITQFINQLPPSQKTLSARQLIIVKDTYSGLKSGTNQNWGVCIVAGTGSNCYGLSTTNTESSAGNWGYLLGDQGSGFAIGQSILKLVMQEYDGRIPKSPLTDHVLQFIKLKKPSDIISWAYQRPNMVTEISSLALVCDQPEVSRLNSINQILESTVKSILLAYIAVVTRLNMKQDNNIPIILIGGLFRNKVNITDPLTHQIGITTPSVNITTSPKEPVYGSLSIINTYLSQQPLPPSAIVISQ